MLVPSERRELFGVLQAKRIYEDLIREKKKSRFIFYDISPTSKKGNVNYEAFRKIILICRSLGVTVEDYLTVLVTQVRYPLGRIRAPYLTFIASQGGKNVFTFQFARMQRSFGSRKIVKNVIKAATTSEQFFTGCFYGGATIFESLLSRVGKDGLSFPFGVLEVLLAFPDVFTPQFVATHSSFLDIMQGDKKELTSDEEQIKMAALLVTEEVLSRAYRDEKYAERLFSARESVKARERITVKRFSSEETEIWRKAWFLLD